MKNGQRPSERYGEGKDRTKTDRHGQIRTETGVERRKDCLIKINIQMKKCVARKIISFS